MQWVEMDKFKLASEKLKESHHHHPALIFLKLLPIFIFFFGWSEQSYN